MISLLVLVIVYSVQADYWTERAQLIALDQSQAIGASIVLNEKEQIANKQLMTVKLKEYDKSLKHPAQFLPALHFFHSKRRMEKRPLFDIIRKIPKGASLHCHDSASVSFDYLYNLTFRENLYGCVVNNSLQLHFFGDNVDSKCEWQLLQHMREANTSFDKFVKSQLTLVVADPVSEYPTITAVWNRFQQIFSTVNGMITYRPVFEDYFYQVLSELYDDNVMYIEARSILPNVYELNGTTYNPVEVVGLYKNIVEEFKKVHPDFHGGRIIYAPSRHVNNKTAHNYVEIAKKVKEAYPNFFAGFDLVGPENRGKPLVDFIPELLQLSNEANMKFFFHSAETNWFGATDMNLFDAILLNTTRIGHGYGIVKHPTILQEVKSRKIALEISPISNQVLKLVDDLRNHPAAFLISEDYPVVITCDDPSFWGAKALSYDWYVAFMAFASRDSDLRLLKQLALNSLLYSAMDDEEKKNAIANWEKQWDNFINVYVKLNDSDCCSINIVR